MAEAPGRTLMRCEQLCAQSCTADLHTSGDVMNPKSRFGFMELKVSWISDQDS